VVTKLRLDYVDDSMSIVTATISATNATAEPINHGLERLTPNPTSATMSNIAAANSAMSAKPCKVTMVFVVAPWRLWRYRSAGTFNAAFL
jgi:hypothetical protein